ncbi:uncharacterized protein LOC141680879 [Apium graveolens]|uniref:uncharacterized protein LOC141680879 n=1 Tax=Apium graveolens TaxID=4045 RepID=UPI003D794C2D
MSEGDKAKTRKCAKSEVDRKINELVWNQRGTDIVGVVVSARVAFNQWHQAQDKTFDIFLSHLTNADGSEHWTLPMENTVKVNSDAAIFEASNCYSYSLVARNSKGELIHAKSRCRLGQAAPDSAEAMGVREALSWIKEQQYRDVVLETDCLVVVQALRGSGALLSYFGRIIVECKKLLEELKDRNVSVIFVKRSANKVADFLAKSTCSVADRIWRVIESPGAHRCIDE